jgi:RNA polymerase sigma-70 factor (ECF subfamily)
MFESESSFVWNSLRRLGVPPRDLEDVAHDVFSTVYRRLDDYDTSRPLRPWLFGIAFRVAARYRELARNQRELLEGDLPEPVDQSPTVDEQLIAEESRRLITEAMETLDLDRRAVLLLHDLEGCAMPDIALALSVPLNTAYSRLRLARADLKAAVSRLRARRGEA